MYYDQQLTPDWIDFLSYYTTGLFQDQIERNLLVKKK